MKVDVPYTKEDAYIELMKDKNFQKLQRIFDLELDFSKQKRK